VTRGLLLLALLAVSLAVAPANASVADHNPVALADPRGDGNGAADVVRVSVANGIGGLIIFLIQVADREGILANDVVVISLDTDRSAQTGEGSADYQIRLDGATQQTKLFRWNGAQFDELAAPSVQGVWSNGYGFGIQRSEIGSPSALRFFATTQLAGASGQSDRAPDAALHEYVLSTPHVAGGAFKFTPTAPRAGATFRLDPPQLLLESEEVVPAATYACRATLGGKRLRGIGRGGCTFRLAKTAKGKRLVVTVTAAPRGGRSATFRPQTFRVR
jgi:hypothetical protein